MKIDQLHQLDLILIYLVHLISIMDYCPVTEDPCHSSTKQCQDTYGQDDSICDPPPDHEVLQELEVQLSLIDLPDEEVHKKALVEMAKRVPESFRNVINIIDGYRIFWKELRAEISDTRVKLDLLNTERQKILESINCFTETVLRLDEKSVQRLIDFSDEYVVEIDLIEHELKIQTCQSKLLQWLFTKLQLGDHDSEGHLCKICLNGSVTNVLPCGHVLCGNCVKDVLWKCPICRHRFTLAEVYRLFLD